MRVIAFTGKKGSGKDTAAYPLRMLGYLHLNFADPVRTLCHEMFNLTQAEMHDPIAKEEELTRWPYQTPRELMQQIAQTSRDLWPDVWMMHLKRRLSIEMTRTRLTAPPPGIVITDLRYLNEEMMLKNNNATIIRITRSSIKPNRFSNHLSETEQDQIVPHWTLTNDGDPDQLHRAIKSLMADGQISKPSGLVA